MLTSPSHVIVLPRSSGEDGMSLPLVGLGKVIGNANAGTGTAGSWGIHVVRPIGQRDVFLVVSSNIPSSIVASTWNSIGFTCVLFLMEVILCVLVSFTRRWRLAEGLRCATMR